MRGTGPKGRIVKADIEGFQPAAAPAAAAPAPAAVPAAAPASSGPSADQVAKLYADRPYAEIKLDGMRKTIAARLTEAKQQIPHFYLRRDIGLDVLLEVRKKMNARGEKQGFKLSVNDFVIKACAAALQRVPAANAVWAGDRILQMENSDVAVAVAIEGGLITPVIQDAQAKGLAQISDEMKGLAARARDRKLMPHEYQGGSFAISNLGMFGIDNFDAVINPPHGSILAVGAGVQKPVVRGGDLAVATVHVGHAVGRSPGHRRRPGRAVPRSDQVQPRRSDDDAGLKKRRAGSMPRPALLVGAGNARATQHHSDVASCFCRRCLRRPSRRPCLRPAFFRSSWFTTPVFVAVALHHQEARAFDEFLFRDRPVAVPVVLLEAADHALAHRVQPQRLVFGQAQGAAAVAVEGFQPLGADLVDLVLAD